MRRSALLVALLGLGSLVLRRRAREGRADRVVWNEATTAPDLR